MDEIRSALGARSAAGSATRQPAVVMAEHIRIQYILLNWYVYVATVKYSGDRHQGYPTPARFSQPDASRGFGQFHGRMRVPVTSELRCPTAGMPAKSPIRTTESVC